MPTDKQIELETPTTEDTVIASRHESEGGKTDSKPRKQAKKVAVKKKAAAKKKTATKKVAKTVDSGVDSETKKGVDSETKKQVAAKAVNHPSAQPADTAQNVPVTDTEPGNDNKKKNDNKEKKAAMSEQKQTEKPALAGATAVPPPSQPPPRGGTGLMGFWLKVGAVAVVFIAGIIGLVSFFGDDEADSETTTTPATASTRGDKVPVANPMTPDSRATPPQGVVMLPSSQRSNVNIQVIEPPPYQDYRQAPGARAGAAVVPANTAGAPAVSAPLGGAPAASAPLGGAPAVSAPLGGAPAFKTPTDATAGTGSATPGVAPAADRAAAGRWDSASPAPRSNYFTDQPREYRPELYRPLEPEQATSAPSQTGGVAVQSTSPQAVPSQPPQPGTTYTYPPAPTYGGYGNPQPGTYGYPPAPYYGSGYRPYYRY